MATESAQGVSLEAFERLPRASRLFVSYSLWLDRRQLPVVKRDRDADALLRLGWLDKKPSLNSSIVVLEWKEPVWEALGKLREAILGAVTEAQMTAYRKRKNASYPWVL